jgi:hypothetical protein
MQYTIHDRKRKPSGESIGDGGVLDTAFTEASPIRQRQRQMAVPDYLKDVSAAVNSGIPEEPPSALQEWRDRKLAEDDVGFGGDTALEGGVFQAVSRVGDLIKGVSRIPVHLDEALGGEQGGYARFLDRTFDPLVDVAFGTRQAVDRQYPGVTWEQVKKEFGDQDVGTGEFLSTLGGFMLKEGMGSLPDMAALIYAPYAYMGTRTSEIASERRENSGDPTSVADLAISGATAAVVQYLDKVALRALNVRVDAGLEKALSKVISDTSVKATAMRVGGGIGTEMATEATQEYIEFVGSTVRDNLGDIIAQATDPAAAEAALIGAVAASGFGAAVATTTEITGRLNARKAGPSDDENAAANSGGTPQLPGPLKPLLLPPPEQTSGPAIPMPPPGGPTPPEDPGEMTASIGNEGDVVAPPTKTAGDYGLDDTLVTDTTSDNQTALQNLTRAGAAYKGTAIDQLLRSARSGVPDEVLPSGDADRARRNTPGPAVERLFDNLMKLTAVRSRELEERLTEPGGARQQRQLWDQLSRALEQQSKTLQDLRDMVRSFVRAEVNAPPVEAVIGALAEQTVIMQRLGLPAKELASAMKGPNAEAVRAIIDQINEVAGGYVMRAASEGTDTQPMEREDIPKELEGFKDPKSRRAREFMADAEMQGRNTSKSGAATMTAEAMGTGKVPYTEEVVSEEGRSSFRMKKEAYGTEEAKERRRLIREEQQEKERQQFGYFTDYTREGAQYEGVRQALLDNPRRDPDDPTGAIELAEALEDQVADMKRDLKTLTGKERIALAKTVKETQARIKRLRAGEEEGNAETDAELVVKPQPVKRLTPAQASEVDKVRGRISELQEMLKDAPPRTRKRAFSTAAERERTELLKRIDLLPKGSKRRADAQRRLEDLNHRIAAQPTQTKIQTQDGSKPLPGGKILRYFQTNRDAVTQGDRLARADRAERDGLAALGSDVEVPARIQLRLKMLDAKLKKLSPEQRAEVQGELQYLTDYLNLWDQEVETQTPKQAAGGRVRAPNDSKKILRDNVIEARRSAEKAQRMQRDFDLRSLELASAQRKAADADAIEKMEKALKEAQIEANKKDAELRGVEYNADDYREPKPYTIQPTGRFAGQDLYKLTETLRAEIRDLEAQRRKLTADDRAEIDAKLKELRSRLAQVEQERAALRFSEGPPAPIDKSPSGVSEARRERAKKLLAAYSRQQKKTGKGTPLNTVKMVALLAQSEKISDYGLPPIYVYNPGQAKEDPDNPHKAIERVRGAYPKRQVIQDEKGHITEMWRPQPYKLTDRKEQKAFEKKTGFLAPKNREFYLEEDVAVVRAQPAALMIKEADGRTRDLPGRFLEMDRTIHPVAVDKVLNMVRELDIPWDGPVDEFGVTQYLLSLKAPKAPKVGRKRSPSSSTGVSPRFQRMIDEQPADDGTPFIDDELDDGFIDGIIDLYPTTNNPDERTNYRALLKEKIAEREALIENIKAERGNLMDVVRSTPIENDILVAEPHDAWLVPPTMFNIHVVRDGDSIGDRFGLDMTPIADGQSVNEAMYQYVDAEIDALLASMEVMLEQDRQELEKMDEPGSTSTPRPRKEGKGGSTQGPAQTPPQHEGDGGGLDGGDVDPRRSGVERAPEKRRAADLFLGVGQGKGSVAHLVDRAATYLVPRVDGRPGLTDEQATGALLMVKAWLDKASKGFINLDGTGFGKSRQILAAADMIASFEEEKETRRPILILIPGREGEANRLRSNVRKVEGPAIGVDIDAKYSDGTPKFVYQTYRFLESNNQTQWAAVVADEAHNVKGKSIWGPAFRELKTDFRAFFTATPTDSAGQELYYLQYLANEGKETYAETEARLIQQLNLRDKESGKAGYELRGQPEKYVATLDKIMREVASKGRAVARTFGRLSRNFVTTVPPEQIDRKAEEVYNRLLARGDRPSDPHMQHLVEHMKVPYMVAQTKAQINEQGRKVIAVFMAANPSKHPDLVKSGLSDPAAFRFKEALVTTEGILPAYYVGEKATDKEIEFFQGKDQSPKDGDGLVFITTDSKGGTGLSLNDRWGVRPRYMMIANTFTQGEKLMQTIGRHDRSNNATYPYTEIVKVDNDTDREWRRGIAAKILVQDIATGYREGRKQYDELNQPQIYEEEAFLARRRAAMMLSSNVDAAIVESVQRGDDARSVVSKLARSIENPQLAALADQLLSMEDGWSNLSIETINSFDDVMGRYIPTTQTIQIQERTAAAQTLMHELVHHFTYANMQKNPQMVSELQALMRAAVEADPDLAQRFPNAFRHEREFVAEIFTDPDFMAEMKTTNVGSSGGKMSMFQRFVRWVGKLLGVTVGQDSVLDRVIAMPLFRSPDGLDFDSMPLHRLLPPNVDGTRTSRMAKRFDAWASRNQLKARAGSKGDKLFRAMLWTMTYSQIVDSFGSYFNRELDSGKPGNIAEDMENVRELIDASANEANSDYHEKVIQPMRDFATGVGSKMISVRLHEGQAEPEEMTRLEYLAHVMNVSGYANLHFTKPPLHPSNRMLKSDKTARAAWKMHRKQFMRPEMAEARELYTKLADYFEAQRTDRRRILGGMFLDTIYDDAPTPWSERSLADINAKLKELGGLTDEELEKLGGSRDGIKQIKQVLQPGKVQGAYFPLRRYGDYVVVADGDQAYYSDAERDALLARYPFATDDAKGGRVTYKVMARFDNQVQAENYREQLEKDFGGNGHLKVYPVMIRAEPMNVIDGRANMFSPLMANFTKNLNKKGLDTAQTKSLQTLFAQTLLDMMPETSVAQSLRTREGVYGASLDIQRVLHNHGASQGFTMANLKYARKRTDLMVELNAHVRGLEKRHPAGKRMEIVRQVLNDREMRASAQMVDLGRLPQTLSDVGFLYYLVGASYNIVNATQVPLVAGPYLSARYGAAATSKALGTAYAVAGKHPATSLLKTGGSLTQLRGLFSKPSKRKDFDRNAYDIARPMAEAMTDPNHKKLIQEMIALGDIEASMAMDMARMSERAHVDEQGRPVPTSAWDYVTDWMRTAPHTVEIMNRSVVAIAAFELEYARSKNYEKAKRVARQAVKQTQFVYKNWNKPPAFQHPGGRLMLMFKQHVQHMYYYMIRNAAIAANSKADPAERATARKALAYLVLMHVMAAGVVGGTPEMAKWLLALGYWALGYDEPFEYDRMMRNLAYDVFGEAGATFASQGLFGFLGMDISGRVGIDSMLMYDGINTANRDSFFASVMELAGGPLAGLAGRAVDAKSKIQTGMYGRAAEDLLPKAMRDPVRAYRLSTEGFKDLSGKTYLDADAYSWWDFAQQTVGFTPKTSSDVAASRSLGVTRTRMMERRERFFTRFYNAKTAAEREAILDDIRVWNHDNPHFRITRDSIVRSVQQRRRIEARTENGVYIPKSQRQWAAEQQRSF